MDVEITEARKASAGSRGWQRDEAVAGVALPAVAGNALLACELVSFRVSGQHLLRGPSGPSVHAGEAASTRPLGAVRAQI